MLYIKLKINNFSNNIFLIKSFKLTNIFINFILKINKEVLKASNQNFI